MTLAGADRPRASHSIASSEVEHGGGYHVLRRRLVDRGVHQVRGPRVHPRRRRLRRVPAVRRRGQGSNAIGVLRAPRRRRGDRPRGGTRPRPRPRGGRRDGLRRDRPAGQHPAGVHRHDTRVPGGTLRHAGARRRGGRSGGGEGGVREQGRGRVLRRVALPGVRAVLPDAGRLHRTKRRRLRHRPRSGRQGRAIRGAVPQDAGRECPLRPIRQHPPNAPDDRARRVRDPRAARVALRRREARHRLGAHGGDARAGHVRQGLARGRTGVELVRRRGGAKVVALRRRRAACGPNAAARRGRRRRRGSVTPRVPSSLYRSPTRVMDDAPTPTLVVLLRR
mmetsp:Transcript_8977/g.36699  ORF Transcript_8977/g.36699 Transcript_8977/m.36699 type:complete len:336 (-) Transcript_8977:796-1803(-)